MRSLYILVVIALVAVQGFGQSPSQTNLLGKWNVEKIVITPEMFFDLSNIDSTHINFIKQQKKRNYNNSWTSKDSAAVEKQYEKAINGIRQMFVEFKADGSYLTNGVNRGEDKIEGVESGTYTINDGEITLKEDKKPTNVNELKIILLNNTTLIVADKSKGSPITSITFKKLK